MPIALAVALLVQLFLALAILFSFLWVWQEPRLNPRDWAHLLAFPLWSIPSLADLFLAVPIMLVCGLGMLRHRAWAAPTYGVWLILSVLFNAFKPHYFIDLFWFPLLWPMVFVGFVYIAHARWAASHAGSDADRPLDRLADLAARYRLTATVAVLVLTFAATAAFMMLLALASLASPHGFDGPKFALSIPLFYGFVIVTLKTLAEAILFDRRDRAEVQAIGGFMLGGLHPFAGRRASWPFAKLSASRQALRLQTPFGVYAWDKGDPRLSPRRKGMGRFELSRGAGDLPITFLALPWQAKAIANRLAALGYL